MDVQPGLFWREDLREARRQLMAIVGESPTHQDPRAAEEHKVLWRWCEAGPRARLGARDLPEAAEGEARGARRGGEAEDPGRAGRQAALG